MKKTITFLAILIATTLFAQNTSIPDPNFEQALIDLGYDSGAINGLVPTANISGIINLNIENKSIGNLTGIQDFTALQTLNCGYNQINSLDVSNNAALVTLNCYFNGLTNLTINSNPNLVTLNCVANELTSITISSNQQIKNLYCNGNLNLGTMDLSNIPTLEDLDIDSTGLISIDLSNNTNLKFLNVNYNNLMILDVSQNTALTMLKCQDNQLSQLSVNNGNNTNFNTFTAINNPNLTCILVDDAAWSTANWTDIDATASFNDVACTLAMTYVPDDNFEQALIDLGYDSGVLDNFVPTINLSGVTSLDVSNKSIGDLTGIQDFTALVTLNCDNNSIQYLNLTTLTNLENLYCSHNLLNNYINVSQNTALKILYCGYNSLDIFDLSQNLALERLSCYVNQLSTLDVSANTALKSLKCQGNQLTNLNVKNGNNTNFTNFIATNNPNLTCIEVDDYAYSTANWTNIDATASFSENCNGNIPTASVPDDNFETYLETHDANGNIVAMGDATSMGNGVMDDYVPIAKIASVTNLDVSNKSIGDLTGIQDFTALVTLNCDNNSIQNLNVTTLPNLENLYCSYNLLNNYIDVSHNTALKILYCGYNSLDTFDLSQNLALERLSCYVNQLVTLDVSANTALTSLKCQNNQLTELNVKNGNNTNFTNFIATNNPNLTCIQVDDDAYSTANWTNIDATASFNTNCNYDNTYVPDDNFEQALIDLGYDNVLDDYVATSNINNVIILDVQNKNISDLTGIEDFNALQNLNCKQNQLTAIDLSYNTNLTHLNCHDNQLESLDLTHNLNLTYLRCSVNQLQTLDVSMLTQLTEFYCGYNYILTNVDIKNGHNTNISNMHFSATLCTQLTCIQVDNAVWSITTWTHVSDPLLFNENCSTASVQDSSFETQLNLYPNPVKDSFSIINNSNKPINQITIYNLLGEMVLKTMHTNAPINTRNLKAGMYIVKLSNDKAIASKKIIIK